MHRRNKKNRKPQKSTDDVDSLLDSLIKENKKVENKKVEHKNTETKDENDNHNHEHKHEKKNLLTDQTKSVDELIKMAEEMWKALKDHIKENPDFVKLEDKAKLEYFREKMGYREFMTEYPITTRYMVCMGQYSSKAFRRMLDKVRTVVHPPPDKREKGYMEDQWVRRQADYIRYLWEAYQKSHYNHAEAAYVWEDAYTKLKGEFDDFRNKHKESEQRVKEEKEKFKAENAKDLLTRLRSGEKKLNEQEEKELYETLKDRLYKKRFDNTMKQLVEKRKETLAVSEGIGTGAPLPDKDKPTVRMIETVDADRIHEIPKSMLVDREMLSKLPGGKSELLQEIQELDELEYEQDGDIPVEQT